LIKEIFSLIRQIFLTKKREILKKKSKNIL